MNKIREPFITTEILIKTFEIEDLTHSFEYIKDEYEESYFHTIRFDDYSIYISEYLDYTELLGGVYKGNDRLPINFEELDYNKILTKIKKYINNL